MAITSFRPAQERTLRLGRESSHPTLYPARSGGHETAATWAVLGGRITWVSSYQPVIGCSGFGTSRWRGSRGVLMSRTIGQCDPVLAEGIRSFRVGRRARPVSLHLRRSRGQRVHVGWHLLLVGWRTVLPAVPERACGVGALRRTVRAVPRRPVRPAPRGETARPPTFRRPRRDRYPHRARRTALVVLPPQHTAGGTTGDPADRRRGAPRDPHVATPRLQLLPCRQHQDRPRHDVPLHRTVLGLLPATAGGRGRRIARRCCTGVAR
jgi:hypothetical protein